MADAMPARGRGLRYTTTGNAVRACAGVSGCARDTGPGPNVCGREYRVSAGGADELADARATELSDTAADNAAARPNRHAARLSDIATGYMCTIADADADADMDPNRHADADGYADRHADRHADGYADRHGNAGACVR